MQNKGIFHWIALLGLFVLLAANIWTLKQMQEVAAAMQATVGIEVPHGGGAIAPVGGASGANSAKAGESTGYEESSVASSLSESNTAAKLEAAAPTVQSDAAEASSSSVSSAAPAPNAGNPAGAPAQTTPASNESRPALVSPATTTGLYSWGPTWQADRQADLFATMQALSITELYQFIDSSVLESKELPHFLQQAGQMGAKVYYLTGEAEWGLDPAGKKMCQQIEQLYRYNKKAPEGARFAGIQFDVEPYLTAQWKRNEEKGLETFVSAAKSAYTYANERNIAVTLCLPFWYDSLSESLLEELIETACDRVAVMNYDRANEVKNLSDEVAMAQEHKKPLTCVFEFQPVGAHSLTENETYNSLGLAAALKNFEALRAHYQYPQLTFAYHPYATVLKMLG